MLGRNGVHSVLNAKVKEQFFWRPKAAKEYVTGWLDQNKSIFKEGEDNIGEEIGAAVDLGAHMMEKLFLVPEMKGLTQLKYLTLSEAKDEAMKRAESTCSGSEHLGIFAGITKELVDDVERYDEKRRVIVLIHVNNEKLNGGELFVWFLRG